MRSGPPHRINMHSRVFVCTGEYMCGVCVLGGLCVFSVFRVVERALSCCPRLPFYWVVCTGERKMPDFVGPKTCSWWAWAREKKRASWYDFIAFGPRYWAFAETGQGKIARIRQDSCIPHVGCNGLDVFRIISLD
ncbi:hypothetical protein ACP275_07G015600 [Erythranthe tilingii]